MAEYFGVLLDSGTFLSKLLHRTRSDAWAEINRWRTAREAAIEERSIVVHRPVVALVKVTPKPISAAAVGSMGGKARARKLSPRRRTEIARKAALARWMPD